MILEVNSLTKSFKAKTVVDSLSFFVDTKEVVGLLGPNGAGKTTTVNMILSVIRPDSGEILINGIDLVKNRVQALSLTNFSAIYASLPGNLTVYENLKVFGALYSIKDLSKKIDVALEKYNLNRFRNVRYGALSTGEQTKVSLLKAYLSEPKLLLLDEPTASLDPLSAKEIRDYISSFVIERNSAVLLTSHNMKEVEEICHRVIFISEGRVLFNGDPKLLPQEYGRESLEELFIAFANK